MVPTHLQPALAAGWSAVLLHPRGPMANLVNSGHARAEWSSPAGQRTLGQYGLDLATAIRAALGVVWAEAWDDGDGRRMWQEAPDNATGRSVWILPSDADSCSVDEIVAFNPGRPEIWRRRTGLSSVLGADVRLCWGSFAAYESLLPPRTLRLYATPLAWLRGGMDGFCVLDWAALRIGHFNEVERVVCDDRDHAQTVDREIKRIWRAARPPRAPKVGMIKGAATGSMPSRAAAERRDG